MVDQNKAVVCCLLATSAIMLSEKKKRKRKMWSKKWYLKLRKVWDSLSELRCSLYERRLERAVLRPALLPVKIAQLTQFFR
jgi:hypothetical protein